MKKAFKQVMLVIIPCLSLSVTGFAIAQDTMHSNNIQGQENANQYVGSSALTVKVKAKLMADDTVKSLPITVNSYKSTIQLAGFVDDVQQVNAAIRAAKSVEGVKQVRNCLIIKH